MRELLIGDKLIRFHCSAALPREYMITHNRDIYKDMALLVSGAEGYEKIAVYEDLAYSMAKHADKTITSDVSEWLSQFSLGDLQEHYADFIDIWIENTQTHSESKKKID